MTPHLTAAIAAFRADLGGLHEVAQPGEGLAEGLICVRFCPVLLERLEDVLEVACLASRSESY